MRLLDLLQVFQDQENIIVPILLSQNYFFPIHILTKIFENLRVF